MAAPAVEAGDNRPHDLPSVNGDEEAIAVLADELAEHFERVRHALKCPGPPPELQHCLAFPEPAGPDLNARHAVAHQPS
jgi:hypothetical protein